MSEQHKNVITPVIGNERRKKTKQRKTRLAESKVGRDVWFGNETWGFLVEGEFSGNKSDIPAVFYYLALFNSTLHHRHRIGCLREGSVSLALLVTFVISEQIFQNVLGASLMLEIYL